MSTNGHGEGINRCGGLFHRHYLVVTDGHGVSVAHNRYGMSAFYLPLMAY